MKMHYSMMMLALVLTGGHAAAATEDTCRACHTLTTKLVGPPFREVAARYKDDQQAIEKLKKSMLEGSQGKWGNAAMPANVGLTPAEADRFAHWVMGLNATNKQ